MEQSYDPRAHFSVFLLKNSSFLWDAKLFSFIIYMFFWFVESSRKDQILQLLYALVSIYQFKLSHWSR